MRTRPSPRRTRLFVGLALALVAAPAACDRGSKGAPSGASAPSSAAVASASTPVDVPLPAPIVLPEGRCALREKAWTSAGFSVRLADANGAPGAPFAVVGQLAGIFGAFASERGAELRIPIGPAGRLGLRLETPQLVLEGLVEASTVPLRVARARVLGGLVIPTRGTPLRIVETTTDGVLVEPELGAEIALTAPLRARLPCAELALEAPELDPAAALPAKPIGRASLRAGTTVALAREPAGAVAAKLTPKVDSGVDVLESRGGAARVAWGGGGALMFGWVAAADLGPALESGGRVRGEEGAMGRPAKPEPVQASVTCEQELPLVAEIGGARVKIGAVRPKARVDVLARDGGYARVHVPAGPLEAAPGARWLVPERALAGCAAAKAESSPYGQGGPAGALGKSHP